METWEWQVIYRVFIRHRRSKNSPFTTQNSPAKGHSLWLFFTQMWILFENILLECYTFLLILEFAMKTLYLTIIMNEAIVSMMWRIYADWGECYLLLRQRLPCHCLETRLLLFVLIVGNIKYCHHDFALTSSKDCKCWLVMINKPSYWSQSETA